MKFTEGARRIWHRVIRSNIDFEREGPQEANAANHGMIGIVTDEQIRRIVASYPPGTRTIQAPVTRDANGRLVVHILLGSRPE